LRLDTGEAIRRGGKHGPVILTNDVAKSPLLWRVAATDAYEKVVDRLLASRPYAERWARHWMDIWRCADWYGRRHVPDVWNSGPQV